MTALRVLSLGAGVQSTTLALMAARSEIPAPDVAIFADTQWESRVVYDHLRWLMSPNVHPQRVLLDEVDLTAQLGRDARQLDLFGNECEGVCGV